jgi:hypothetical protein
MTFQELNGRTIEMLCKMSENVFTDHFCQFESYPQGFKCYQNAVVGEIESEQALCMKHYRERQ